MDKSRVNDRLKRYRANPRAFMKAHPTRSGGARSAFDTHDISSRRFVTAGDELRKRQFSVVDGVVVALEDVLPGRAPMGVRDDPASLADVIEHRTLKSIEDAGLTSAKLAETPWSDDYWAIYLGQLGKRYADPRFPASTDWEANHDYVADNPAGDVVAGGDKDAINRLSPSEKYDLLLGDSAFTLTQHMWEQGRYYFEKDGKVETWMGVCHGWACAAYMLPRPAKAITLIAGDGVTPITFYPSDIKALASQLWARARTASRFIGGRCNDKDPATDENGRVISERCFDTNPGAWHLAVVNQIGVAKRSFIIDATYDYEVWNQPVFEYDYVPVNPVHDAVAPLEDAIVPIHMLPDDTYAKYRSEKAKYVTAVYMDLTYVVETAPTHSPTDGPDKDGVKTVEYYYDLELDKDLNIIGGEWRQQTHPDFLWTPAPTTRAITPADQFAQGVWRGDSVPKQWRAGARTGARQGLPLSAVVEGLIERAR